VKNKKITEAAHAMKTHLSALNSKSAASQIPAVDYKTKAIAHRLSLLAAKQS